MQRSWRHVFSVTKDDARIKKADASIRIRDGRIRGSDAGDHRDASVARIARVEWPSEDHLYWPDLDIDLSVRSIEHPEEFPLVFHAEN
jgi:hypothetical protein